MKTTRHDPELYAELSQEASTEHATRRLNQFVAEVERLRSELKIPEVVFAAGVKTAGGLAAVDAHFGYVGTAAVLAKTLYESIAVEYVDGMVRR